MNDFQIFVSSESVQNLPLALLTESLKMTMEPAKGIKNTLLSLV